MIKNNLYDARTYLSSPESALPNQTIPNHTKLIIMRSFKYFEKIPILGKCLSLILSPLRITSLQFFQIPMSVVPCLMSNVQCQKSHVWLKQKILTIPGLLELDSEAAPSCFDLLLTMNNIWFDLNEFWIFLTSQNIGATWMYGIISYLYFKFKVQNVDNKLTMLLEILAGQIQAWNIDGVL